MKKTLIIALLILSSTIVFSQTFNKQRLNSLFQVMEKNNKFMGSIVVSQNGKLLYSNTIGFADVETSKKADNQTKYRIGSISKMFTASLILKAVDENKISLSQTLDTYFSQIENSPQITIGNLLNHRSGIHDLTHNDDFMTYNTVPKSEKQMIDIIAKGKSDFSPNSRTEYSNSNFVVLSYILQKIYKEPYTEILDTKIIKPLDLKSTYFGSKIGAQNNESFSYHFTNKWQKATITDMSIPMGAGGIVSTAKDLTTFIEQLFKGKIVSKKSLKIMQTMNDFQGIGVGSGMLAFNNFDKKSYGHNGAIDDFQSILSYSPEENLTVSITSNGLSYPMNNILLCALSCYFDKPFTLPNFTILTVKPEVLDLYLGQYASKQFPLKIVITKSENKLFGQATGQPDFPLEATADNMFKFEQAGIVLKFDADKKQMVFKQGPSEYLFIKE